MEIKAKRLRNKDEIELMFYKVLDDLQTTEPDEKVTRVANVLLSYRAKIVKVIKEEEGNIIAYDGDYFYIFPNSNKFIVGENLCIYSDDYVFRIAPEVVNLDLNTVDGEISEIDDYIEEIGDIDVLTLDMVNNFIKVEKQKQEEKLLEREKVKEEQTKEKTEEQKIYEKDSIGDFNNLGVDKNTISVYGSKYILDKNINEIWTYSQLVEDSYNISDNLRNILVNKRQSYTRFEDNIKAEEVTFDIETKINGVVVNTSRVMFILRRLSRLHPQTTETIEEEIKLLNNLTGMRVDFLNLKEIKFYSNNLNLDMPATVNLIDKNTFKIDFLGQEKEFKWKDVLEYFFYPNSRSLLNSWELNKLLRYANLLNLGKQDIYDYLKKLNMLTSLEAEG